MKQNYEFLALFNINLHYLQYGSGIIFSLTYIFKSFISIFLKPFKNAI